MGLYMYVDADVYESLSAESAENWVEQGIEFEVGEAASEKSPAHEAARKKTGLRGAVDTLFAIKAEYIILLAQILCLLDFFVCCYIGDNCTGWIVDMATESYQLDIVLLLILGFFAIKRFFADGEMSFCGFISVLAAVFFLLMVIASAIVVIGIIYFVICLFEGFGMPYFYYFY